MPLTEDGYVPLNTDQIYRRLKNDFQDRFDQTVQPGSIVNDQLMAEAETLAENQEKSIQRVYESAYIEDATGKNLEKLVKRVGLTRREASRATGVIEFRREEGAETNYVIPRNEVVQTRGKNPIEFTTREMVEIQPVSDFENDLEDWTGDEADFAIETTTPLDGDKSLVVPATVGSRIVTTDEEFGIGTTFDLSLRQGTDASTAIQFGVNGPDNYHEVEIDQGASDLRLRSVVDGVEDGLKTETVTTAADTTYHIEIDWSIFGQLVVTVYGSQSKETVVGTVSLDYEPDWTEGAIAIVSRDSSATALADTIYTSAVTANIRAKTGGVDGNVGPNQIAVSRNGLTGVTDITNPVATGDSSYLDTNLSPLTLGQKREDDAALRQRAFENSSIGGAASRSALEATMSQLDSVQSVSTKRNRSYEFVDGLPPHSYELIIYGGDAAKIAEIMDQTASIDSQDVGGIHGTEVTYDVESDVTGSVDTYHWSSPAEINLDITIDLIVDDTYIGDSAIRSLIINYVGGTDNDGSQVAGLSNGEDVYLSVLKTKLINPDETGVWEVDALTVDDNADGTDDTVELANGANVYSISDEEVAITNARDGSITVNTVMK